MVQDPADRGLLPIGALPLRREVVRKLIHLSSVAVPVFVWFAPRSLAILALVTGAALAVLVEVVRFGFRPARHFFLSRTRRLLRRHERTSLSGATYLAISYAAAVVLLPKPIAILAMVYSGVGDAMAAVVGRRFGRHRIRERKSAEGAAAILGVALIAGLLMPDIPPMAALSGALAATGLEAADLPPDDNVWVTLGGGAVVWITAGLV